MVTGGRSGKGEAAQGCHPPEGPGRACRIRIAEGTPDIIAGDEMRPELEIAAADIERESRRTVFRRHHVTEYESSGTGIPHLSILPARIRETI